MRRVNLCPVLQVPYLNEVDMDDIHAVLKGSISKVDTRPKVVPVS